MLDFLYQIDVSFFYFVNHNLSNPIFDNFFSFLTEVKHWYISYVILILFLIVKGGKKGRIAAVMVLLLVTATDQVSSSLIKNLVERIRPCNALPDVNILAGCTSSFSFPSSHAVNNFAVAFFFLLLYPRYKWALIITASLLAVSRVYVGVHYPSDIIAGAVIGSIFGYLFGAATIKLDNLFNKSKKTG